MIGFLILFLVGVISATFGSIVGLGGGIIIVPVLIYFGESLYGSPISTQAAVGTSLVVLIFTALSSTLSYFKHKKIDFRSGWLFFATSGPAAILGASLTGSIPEHSFQLYFGCFMLFVALLMMFKNYLKPVAIQWKIQRSVLDEFGDPVSFGYNITSALAVGFGVGIISGLFGIGGGSLFVPLMVLLFGYPAHVATATSMFVILLSAITGSVTHLAFGEVNGFVVLALAPGAWIGGRLGARIALRMSGNGLLWLLRITLVLFAARMIWGGLT